MTFKILLFSHCMLNTQFLTPLFKKKKKRKARKGKKTKVLVLASDNMEEYVLHIREKKF